MIKRFIPYLLILSVMIPFASARGEGPAVSAVYYPQNMVPDTAYHLYAIVSSPLGIQSCNLFIDGADKGAMTMNGADAGATSTFTQIGVYTAIVTCHDSTGNASSGLSTPITIQEKWDVPDSGTLPTGSPTSSQGTQYPPPGTPPSNTPPSGQPPSGLPGAPSGSGSAGASLPPLTSPPSSVGVLIKLVCPDGAAPDNPCKAVYYYGADRMRHAFPNEKVYFTWYANFDSVRTITDAALGDIPLGKNVTYRPGIKMVKFTTVDNVYAVSKGGNLRWVTSEEVANGLYGIDWNKRIDDISDAFYSNYSFGSAVSSTADYVISTEMNAATVIDQSL